MAEDNKIVTDVQLVAEFRDGKPVYESVPAVKTGDARFRILSSPGFAPGVASGDEIELRSDDPLGYRVLKRGGNICVQLFLESASESDCQEVGKLVESIGGIVDGGLDGEAGRLMIFTIPFAVGFSEIESVMDDVSSRYSVDKWMYGNVYDVKDGVTPLNWWDE